MREVVSAPLSSVWRQVDQFIVVLRGRTDAETFGVTLVRKDGRWLVTNGIGPSPERRGPLVLASPTGFADARLGGSLWTPPAGSHLTARDPEGRTSSEIDMSRRHQLLLSVGLVAVIALGHRELARAGQGSQIAIIDASGESATSERRRNLGRPFEGSGHCSERKPAKTIRESLGAGVEAIRVHHYDKPTWSNMTGDAVEGERPSEPQSASGIQSSPRPGSLSDVRRRVEGWTWR